MPTKRFLLLTPIVLLFAAGVFMRSATKTTPDIACATADFSGVPALDALAIFEGRELSVPTAIAAAPSHTDVLGVASPSERWIEVDLSDQKLYAWDGSSLFLESAISSGLPQTPTPTGEFRVWIKLRATKMEGGVGRYYYNLPNVPYVMFFENENIPGWRGYGIHGTYWHNDFGTPRSHGCVNAPTKIAEKLFYWASPELPDGRYTAKSTESDPGIRVIIHE